MKDNIITDKTFNFAVRIIRLCQYLNQHHQEFILSKQLMRCGTSIGANVSEAQYAQSRADFVSKMKIALKEANETQYWLRLLYKTGYLSQSQFDSMYQDISDILRLLTTICKSCE